MKAMELVMKRAIKLRKDWKDCTKCHHLIASEGYPLICQCRDM